MEEGSLISSTCLQYFKEMREFFNLASKQESSWSDYNCNADEKKEEYLISNDFHINEDSNNAVFGTTLNNEEVKSVDSNNQEQSDINMDNMFLQPNSNDSKIKRKRASNNERARKCRLRK